MPDTRPNIKFSDGICTACINFEKQNTTDWKKRFDELTALCDKYRGCNGNGYDCAIAVSGGKDSISLIHLASQLIPKHKIYAVHINHGIRKESLSCLLYTSPSPRDGLLSRMPSSA